MKNSAIEKEYAKALFSLAVKVNRLEVIDYELEQVAAVVRDNPRVRTFLDAPQLSSEKKLETLRKALEGRVDPLLEKFLLVLVEKRRQDSLLGIQDAMRDLVNDSKNQVEVRAVTAVSLDDEEVKSLTNKLARMLDSEIILKQEVDGDLIGGLVCRIGDKVFDGSLRGKLERLGRRMLKASN